MRFIRCRQGSRLWDQRPLRSFMTGGSESRKDCSLAPMRWPGRLDCSWSAVARDRCPGSRAEWPSCGCHPAKRLFMRCFGMVCRRSPQGAPFRLAICHRSIAAVRLCRKFVEIRARRRLPAILALLGDDVGEDAAAHVPHRRHRHHDGVDGDLRGRNRRRPQAGSADLHDADQGRGVHRPGLGLF